MTRGRLKACAAPKSAEVESCRSKGDKAYPTSYDRNNNGCYHNSHGRD
jgi:hypothetical protein